jgi:acetolactate synthase-1/2/3 large subunit
MKTSDYIARYLAKRGISHVFELIGGTITYLLDSLQQQTSIRIVSMHHEQGAGFAAEAYGRMTGLPGIAMATSGPGATNLITAIGSCYFDSTPAIFMTGQIPRDEKKGSRPIRQLGFQETDIVGIARPITKAALSLDDPADLPRVLEEAFDLALGGRPGPVLLDIPMDVQLAEIIDLRRLEAIGDTDITTDRDARNETEADAFWNSIRADLAGAQRPLILAGGGIRTGRAAEAFRRLVSALGVPVVHSLMAIDALPSDDPLRVGLIGTYGNRWANTALGECDFLLVLGSRLDGRQTGNDVAGFKGSRAIYHVDCDQGELNNRIKGCHTLTMELDAFLDACLRTEPLSHERPAWTAFLGELRRRWPDTEELRTVEGINPNRFMHLLSAASRDAVAFVADVGQHQMWAAQSLDLHAGQRFLNSGGMGSMGFALPAAIGASFATGERPVVVIAGDGGFQINIQELQTIKRNQLPLKMVVINNQCHGMVRQIQETAFNARYQSTLWGYDAPSFTKVALAYGIPSAFVEEEARIPEALNLMWADPHAPFLLEVGIHVMANAYPKMVHGKPLSEMEPVLEPLDVAVT